MEQIFVAIGCLSYFILYIQGIETFYAYFEMQFKKGIYREREVGGFILNIVYPSP